MGPNDVQLYTAVLPQIVEVFFSLNRPNYALWGTLFLKKLEDLNPTALDILKSGAFTKRRTQKSFSRAPIDLTLEQTVNRDAASSATGITHFANSESAFRRCCTNLTQRNMSVSELKEMSGYHAGENPANQMRNHRIIRDKNDSQLFHEALRNTCDPFSPTTPIELVNIVTGKLASPCTSNYLIRTLK